MIEELKITEYKVTEYPVVPDVIKKVNELIQWVNDHQKNTLKRFEDELVELIKSNTSVTTEIENACMKLLKEKILVGVAEDLVRKVKDKLDDKIIS